MSHENSEKWQKTKESHRKIPKQSYIHNYKDITSIYIIILCRFYKDFIKIYLLTNSQFNQKAQTESVARHCTMLSISDAWKFSNSE